MIRVLDASADEAEWLRIWEQSGREPHGHPAYGRLLAGPGERPVAVVVQVPGGTALVPLTLRPLPWDVDGWDAVSPYGYGGPFVTAGLSHEAALEHLAVWAAEEGICSVFLRLSLDVEVSAGTRSPGLDVRELFDNVVVDLRRTPDEVWMGYEHKVRKNVNKALRAGCTVVRSDGFDDLAAFIDVYSETMRRRNASDWFRFDRAFFSGMAEELADCCCIFSVLDVTGRVISVELVLASGESLYSFLGGTREQAFSCSPNDLLKHEVIQHGLRSGRSRYVLGGGFEPGDGIFRYKKSFDPAGVRPFRVARIIGDGELYSELVDERVRRHGPLPDGQFFPAYRAPATAASRGG